MLVVVGGNCEPEVASSPVLPPLLNETGGLVGEDDPMVVRCEFMRLGTEDLPRCVCSQMPGSWALLETESMGMLAVRPSGTRSSWKRIRLACTSPTRANIDLTQLYVSRIDGAKGIRRARNGACQRVSIARDACAAHHRPKCVEDLAGARYVHV